MWFGVRTRGEPKAMDLRRHFEDPPKESSVSSQFNPDTENRTSGGLGLGG